VDVRVAIDLRGRRLKDFGFQPLGKTEHVDRADDAGLCRLYGIELVVDRRCRAGEIVDFIGFNKERMRYVVAHRLEIRVAQQVYDVGFATVKELSTQSTSWPSRRRRSHKCDRRKPAAPVTRILLRSVDTRTLPSKVDCQAEDFRVLSPAFQ
jgi:hypothetical protein